MWQFLRQVLSPGTHSVPGPGRPRQRRLELDLLEGRVTPASLVVNTLADNTLADSTLTLREAVLLVNAQGRAQAALGRCLTTGERAQVSGLFNDTRSTIAVAPFLANQTLRLNGTPLTLTRSVLISTFALDRFTIDANNASRAFNIDDGTSGRIDVQFQGSPNQGLWVVNGNAIGGGGAIRNTENLTLDGCTVLNNRATFGGGICNTGTLTIQNFSLLRLNVAAEGKGGGAIYNTGSLVITNSFLNVNRATYGGAIVNYGPGLATILNGGFDGNSATGIDGGGAILNSGQLTFDGVGFTFNSADNGHGGAIHSIGGRTTGKGNFNFKSNHALAGGALFNDSYSTMILAGSGSINHGYVREGNGGGGVYNRGTFCATGVIFEANAATYGGGFYNAGGTANVAGSAFAGNTATGIDGGGAIANTSTLTLTNVLLQDNASRGRGGGIANYGNLTVSSSTIRTNRADSDGDGSGQGGGIFSTTTVFLRANTITGNLVGTGTTSSDLFGGPFVM